MVKFSFPAPPFIISGMGELDSPGKKGIPLPSAWFGWDSRWPAHFFVGLGASENSWPHRQSSPAPVWNRMRNHWVSSTLLGVALAATLFFARAQQAVAPPASASPGAVDAMQLYLVVHDKKGKPVLDLKPDDLTIIDDGSHVKLDNLRLVDQHQDPAQVFSPRITT
jgi:hypothetical protein